MKLAITTKLASNVRAFVLNQYIGQVENPTPEGAGKAAAEYYKTLGLRLNEKKLDEVSRVATEHFNELIKLNAQKIETPKVQKANEKLNSAKAQKAYASSNIASQDVGGVDKDSANLDKGKNNSKFNETKARKAYEKSPNYYYEYGKMSKQAKYDRKHRAMADNKAAYAEYDDLAILKRVNPEQYEKVVAWRAELNKPVQSNNAGKKEAKAEYESSKKIKAKKKLAEIKSKIEHAKERKKAKTLDKEQRNAKYVTGQGQMKTDARIAYRKVKATSDAFANGAAPFHNAEESFKVFEKYGLTGLSVLDTPIGATPKPDVDVPKPSSTSVQKTVENVVENGKKAVEETVEKAGKGKWGWIAAGIGLVAAAFGGKAYMDKKAEQQLDVAA